MLAVVRRKVDMAVRVWEFFQAHPSSEPGHQYLLGQLEERIARARALQNQQRDGLVLEHEAVSRRLELRRRLAMELLPHLVRVGQVVATERPDLAGRFRLPKASPLREYREVVKSMLDLALAERDLLVSKGLSQALLDDLTVTFAEFEKAAAGTNEGRRDHVGATADLEHVAKGIMGLVRQLDALNRYRFRQDEDLKAAWRSARDLFGPGGGVTPVGDGEGGEVPPQGGIAPAA